MGYIDKQIAAAQKRIGDAVAGKGLQKAIRALQQRSRIGNSLETLPARGAITAKRKVAKPTGSAASSLGSPWAEKVATREWHETPHLVSAPNTLFAMEFYAVKTVIFQTALNATVEQQFLDLDPNYAETP